MVDAHEQVVGVVGLFEKAWRVLVQLRHENFAVALGNGRVRCAAPPDGCPEEECVDELGFGTSIEECDCLNHVGKRKPLADGDKDAVVRASFCNLTDNGECVRGERNLADSCQPFGLFFGADGELRRNGDIAISIVNLDELAKGFGRDVVWEHDGKRNLVAYFRSAENGFGFLVAQNDDGTVFVVVDDDLKVVLDFFVVRREVVENDDVVITEVFGEVFLLFAEP